MHEINGMSAPLHPKKIENLVCEELEEQGAYIYINKDDETTITLNPTGSAVYDMCNGQTTAEEMARVLADTLAAPYEVALRDVENVLLELYGFGFFEE